MVWEPSNPQDAYANPSSDPAGWKMPSKGITFPDTVYFSEEYSTILKNTEETSFAAPITSKKAFAQVTGGAPLECYYIEFDNMGRMTWPRGATRIVLMNGGPVTGEPGKIQPVPRDKEGRPEQVGGLVVFPKGQTSRLRNKAQIFDLY